MDGAWRDLSDDLVGANWDRGRRGPLDPWPIGGALISLRDDDRDYDPLNTTGAWAGHLLPGADMDIYVRKDSGAAWSRAFEGVVDEWAPTSYNGDTTAVTTLLCLGALAKTNAALPQYGADPLLERLSQSRAGVFYPMALDNHGTSGVIEDASGRRADGTCYLDEAGTGTPGASSVEDGSISMGGTASIVAPLPVDPVRDGNGVMVAFHGELGNSHSGTAWNRWAIFHEGMTDDGIWLWLEETLVTPSVSVGTNPMLLKLYIYNDSVAAQVALSLSVGTRSEWTGKDRLILLSMDDTWITLGAGVVDGDGTVAGADYSYTYTANPFRGVLGSSPPPTATVNRLHRLGLSNNGGDEGTLPGWKGIVRTAAVAHVAASLNWWVAAMFATNQRGFFPTDGADRVNEVGTHFGVDTTPGVTVTVTSGINYSEAMPVGGRSGIEILRDVAAVEMGMLYGRIVNTGGVRVRDFDSAQAGGVTMQATYSDVEGSALSYLDGSAKIESGLRHVVNACYVTRPNGETTYAEDATSIAKYGTKALHVDLPVVAASTAGAFAATIVERFKDHRPVVASLVVDPDANPAAWWPEIVVRDIGQRVTVVRRPLDVGSTASIEQIVEGVEWSWSVRTGFTVTYHYSHAGSWDGFSYP